MFSPNDFRDDPYTAGLNQMGHAVFGAALAVVFGVWWAAGIVAAWELHQFYKRRALRWDTIADVTFWTCGIAMAGWHYMPVYAILMAGFWMIFIWARMGK